MTAVAISLVAVVAVLAAFPIALWRYRGQRPRSPLPVTPRRILFPVAAGALSADALDCALRLASAEHATLVPVFLVRVSLNVPLQAALPRQGSVCVRLQEVIEQRAGGFSVAVDARIERGRSYRHALREAITNERFDRIVIAAAHANGPGIAAEDVRWLLDNAPGEIVAIRPSLDRYITPLAPARAPEPARSLAPVG
jgi:hypothetical protein